MMGRQAEETRETEQTETKERPISCWNCYGRLSPTGAKALAYSSLFLFFLISGTTLPISTPLRRIPGFDDLCALSNTSIADGCTLISTGKPITGAESVAWRSRYMGGEWAHILAGARRQREDACNTPLNCALGNSTYIAVDVGVPGHGYCDILWAAPYALAAADPKCNVHIHNVLRTNHDKRGHEWQAYFLSKVFPGAKVIEDKAKVIQISNRAPFYPVSAQNGVCCATCVETDPSLDPLVGFSQVYIVYVVQHSMCIHILCCTTYTILYYVVQYSICSTI
jgi:hypothetical protein